MVVILPLVHIDYLQPTTNVTVSSLKLFLIVCALSSNVPKFAIEVILRDFRFYVLLVMDQSGQPHFVLCTTAFG